MFLLGGVDRDWLRHRPVFQFDFVSKDRDERTGRIFRPRAAV
jgi:hypothetical protein